MPAISVLMPVRNAAPWLSASLGSLWRQTFREFEVIAVDDGSTDGSGELLERAAAREPRLRVFHSSHRGLPVTLDAALALAREDLIARHDADDLSHRERLDLQREYLAAHAEVGVVGCRVRVFPAAGAGMKRWVAWHNALLTHDSMAREVLIDSPLAHGTALIRRRALEEVGGWQDRGWPEDLDLWIRLLAAGHRLAKLPRTLYSWRQHAESATRRDPRYARERFIELRRSALERGLLRGTKQVTLVGVGKSLAEWHTMFVGGERSLRVLPASQPDARTMGALGVPLVLIFGAEPARRRWRAALQAAGLAEGRDFAFVA